MSSEGFAQAISAARPKREIRREGSSYRVLDPRISEVRKMVRELGIKDAASKLGVTVNTLTYFCRTYDIPNPMSEYYFRPWFRAKVDGAKPIAGYSELPKMLRVKARMVQEKPEEPPTIVLTPIDHDGPPRVREIKRAVCERFRITDDELCSPRRQHKYAHPRQMVMLLARELTNHSLPQIARYIGLGDHTTVIQGLRAIKRRMESVPEWRDHYEELRRHLVYRPVNDNPQEAAE